ncbi:unnamed protein product [Didymodactylos carnosus]|uniref:Alpha-type protein kinase domain-containing protein n=1 Tax=Didymodactylos carnosus TaxID=1234261 RepID=A0A814IBU3_9BILA|nr:unnamed protein product [Didymodactylos carnosus]CAF3793254.1 unnamed protein product [Didymodactylos carnosus]
MALFFHSHECNPICKRLQLTPFDISTSEREKHQKHHQRTNSRSLSPKTACRGSEEPVNGLNTLSKFGSFLRRLRSHSSISEDESEGYVSESSSLTTNTMEIHNGGLTIPKRYPQFMTTFSVDHLPLSPPTNMIKIPSASSSFVMASPIYSGTNSDACFHELTFNIEDVYHAANRRASSVILEKVELDKFQEMSIFYEKYESILGQIHLEMCKYHQVGRFSELGCEEFDEEAAYFHLEQAAILNIKEAILSMAKIHLNLSRDILPNYKLNENSNNIEKGFNFMLDASELHEPEAILYLAQAYDMGNDQCFVNQDWKKAVDYYERYVYLREIEMNPLIDDEDSGTGAESGIVSHGQYDTIARIAYLYKTGGHNLRVDHKKAGELFNKAADLAIVSMKGRLANKYYQEAEQSFALADVE